MYYCVFIFCNGEDCIYNFVLAVCFFLVKSAYHMHLCILSINNYKTIIYCFVQIKLNG